jgi:hypothetical protein
LSRWTCSFRSGCLEQSLGLDRTTSSSRRALCLCVQGRTMERALLCCATAGERRYRAISALLAHGFVSSSYLFPFCRTEGYTTGVLDHTYHIQREIRQRKHCSYLHQQPYERSASTFPTTLVGRNPNLATSSPTFGLRHRLRTLISIEYPQSI